MSASHDDNEVATLLRQVCDNQQTQIFLAKSALEIAERSAQRQRIGFILVAVVFVLSLLLGILPYFMFGSAD